MTKDELEIIIQDVQRGAMGCGCCASNRDKKETFDEAVESIWKVIERRKQQ